MNPFITTSRRKLTLLALISLGVSSANSLAAQSGTDEQPVWNPRASKVETAEEKPKRRPTIVNRRLETQKKEAEEEARTKFLHPSLSFLTFLSDYTVDVGDVTILQDDVASLFRKHPECRRIQSLDTSSTTGKVACRNPAVFQAEGSEVIFSYSRTNEVLTGATFSFSSALRAATFAKQITSRIQAKHPTYVESFSEVLKTTDSPMIKVSIQEGQKGYLVLIDSYHEDRFADSEVYAQAKLQEMDFGTVTIGKTTREELPALPKTCEEVSSDPDGLVREFYGLCFGFPYEAHIQLEFDKLTQVLRSAVLSPIGAATGAVVEDALKGRYSLATFCPRITSTVSMGRIKTFKPRSERQKMTRMNKRPASVFAGTCETPIVYTRQMRFIFENRNLSHKDILAEFEQRKTRYEQQSSMQKAFDTRKDSLVGFFD